jgi:hypothetical protein
MRDSNFLRTPVRADHQGRLLDISIGEAPLAGDPQPNDVFPQTLEISFLVDPAVTEVQLAPLWEGYFLFIPDSTAGNPANTADVTRANYPNWSVTGDLVLRSYIDFTVQPNLMTAFAAQIPFIPKIPFLVRYSKIRLSEAFLFDTLQDVFWNSIVFDGGIVTPLDPQFHEKLMIEFLMGRAEVEISVDRSDPSLDTALLAMPEIILAPPNERTVFRISAASRSEKESDLHWFDQNPAYDDLTGELLVDPALQNETDLHFNALHPNLSVIPLLAVYQAASFLSYAPDHDDIALPLRAALSAPLAGGKIFRRVELVRPSIPGAAAGSSPRRPYPMHKLCWKRTDDAVTYSLRIPLSGYLYLPLENGDFDLWAITRSQNPEVFVTGDQVRLSQELPAPARYLGLPQPKLGVSIQSDTEALSLYAHVHPYESSYIWEGFRQVAAAKVALKAQALADWNAAVFDWYQLPTTLAWKPYSALYGYIRESAGRHGLAPEFLQTIAWGEGLQRQVDLHPVFDPLEVLDAFNFLGLDLILYRSGQTMPDGSLPAIPPEIPANNVDELAEYSYNLVAEGYLDPIYAARVSWSRQVVRVEAGGQRTLQVANIVGWDTAIELVAAELHARLDELVNYLGAQVPPVPVVEENQRRFLAYVRFNASPATARQHADNMSNELAAWVGPPPGNNRNVLFNTIQRIAVCQWQEQSRIYRD